MKTPHVLLAVALSFLSAGCVSQRECARNMKRVQAVEQARCREDLDRLAAECANSTGQDAPEDAPIFGRGGFGQPQDR